MKNILPEGMRQFLAETNPHVLSGLLEKPEQQNQPIPDVTVTLENAVLNVTGIRGRFYRRSQYLPDCSVLQASAHLLTLYPNIEYDEELTLVSANFYEKLSSGDRKIGPTNGAPFAIFPGSSGARTFYYGIVIRYGNPSLFQHYISPNVSFYWR